MVGMPRNVSVRYFLLFKQFRVRFMSDFLGKNECTQVVKVAVHTCDVL